tara:strand:+ start:106 stop:783 length:678 start_codon:yes stop_codon:yes gene_type:complete
MIIITGYSSEIGKSTFNLLKKNNNFIFSGRFKPKFLRKTDLWINVDLSSKISVNKYLKELEKQSKITGLIYISAFQSGRQTLEDHSIEQIEKSIAVNFKSPLLIIQTLMKKKFKKFSIVLIGSEAAVYGGNNISVYAITKSALHSFPKSLSKELGKKNIRINLISPSLIRTKKLLKTTANLKELENSIALGRIGEPKEVANLIKWLMSEKSSYITGTVIPISGGR